MFTFPQGFLWGAATSSHQVEGDNQANDWWQWEAAGKVPEQSLEACQHYAKFADDFDLAKSLGHNAHRFSIEWSRVEPRPGYFDQDVIAHYREVLQSLRARGIEPMVTLHHFTNPLWLAEMGGWENEAVRYHFERFAHMMARSFKDLVSYWVTINEPMVLMYYAYVTGTWPPGKQDFGIGLQVQRNFIYAHQRAYLAIHGAYKKAGVPAPKVGMANYLPQHCPHNAASLLDRLATGIRSYIFEHLTYGALMSGQLWVPGVLREKLPLKKSLDFIGVNYYTREFVKFADWGVPGILGELCSAKEHPEIKGRNQMGWESYPEGLYKVLMRLKKYRLPILITENGTCTDNDQDRWIFIEQHLQSVARAIKEGVPVEGYFYWSLMDNFEWAEGYRPRFGLVNVDYQTQARTTRSSAQKYKAVCESNSLMDFEN